jgi:hypothetical protein
MRKLSKKNLGELQEVRNEHRSTGSADSAEAVIRMASYRVPNDKRYQHSREEDDIGVSVGFGNWWAQFRGSNIQLLIVVIAVAVSATFWLILEHDREMKEIWQTVIKNQMTIVRSEEKTKKAVEENTYVLSKSQEEREKLNIAMPDSLREKLMGHR